MASDAGTRPEKKGESWGEILRTVFYALMIALAFRVVLFQPFSIPSGSMKSTLLIGDYLFVSKYAYGYSRHALPFSPPIFEGRILDSEPEVGDVIVFKLPRDGATDYIKRLVGKPGDTVQVISGVLHLNGEAVELRQMPDFVETDANGRTRRHEQYIETLPNGVEHVILNSDDNQRRHDNTPLFEVPEGMYFFMGDNRDNSQDSRFRTVGMVPYENLVGRAEIIFLSSKSSPFLPWDWRFSRIFDIIR